MARVALKVPQRVFQQRKPLPLQAVERGSLGETAGFPSREEDGMDLTRGLMALHNQVVGQKSS